MAQDSPARKRRLRNFLLDPRFQLKYATLIALTGGVVFAVMGGLFFTQVRVSTTLAAIDQASVRAGERPPAARPAPTGDAAKGGDAPVIQIEKEAVETVELPPARAPLPTPAGGDGAFEEELADRLAAEDNQLLWKLVACWAVLVVMLFMLGILVTHRIVGPLYVVDRQLARIIAGEAVRPRALRRGDEFVALFERVNALATQLEGDVARRREVVASARAALRARMAEHSGALTAEQVEGWLGEILGPVEAAVGGQAPG